MKKFLAGICAATLFMIGCGEEKTAPKPAQNIKDKKIVADDYKKAQTAVKAIKLYPAQLVETQDLNKVDAISGASISYSQFVEIATIALNEATK